MVIKAYGVKFVKWVFKNRVRNISFCGLTEKDAFPTMRVVFCCCFVFVCLFLFLAAIPRVAT